MKRFRLWQRARWPLIAVGVVSFMGYKLDHASGEASDRGLTLLAGATSIARGEAYPVVQRPPLYSLLLAGISRTMAVDTSATRPAAREFGNLKRLDVATNLLAVPYRRVVLWVQLVIFCAALLLSVASLDMAGVPKPWIPVAFLMFLLPNAWLPVGQLYDAVLSQFLVALGVYAFVLAVNRGLAVEPLLLAGSSFALAGLSHGKFQLLVPTLVLVLWRPVAQLYGHRSAARLGVVFVSIWLVVVGGWSFRNWRRAGFVGMSAVTGTSLGTKTALFLERARPVFPAEVEAFVPFRNELLVTSKEHDGVLWGAAATEWLMRNRGMGYVEAQKFLTRFNVAAIERAPLRYLQAVGRGLIGFNGAGTPGWPTWVRVPLTLLELALTGLFWFCVVCWLGFRVLSRRLAFEHPRSWLIVDVLAMLVVTIFVYVALVSSAGETGRADQRQDVQLLIPLSIALIVHRFEQFRSWWAESD